MSAVRLRADFGAAPVRRLAAVTLDIDLACRLLAIAAACEGMTREEAAKIVSMDRQALRE